MGKLLDDFAALHNFKQRNGLNPEKGNVTQSYLLERRLLRLLKSKIESRGERIICTASGLTPFQLDEILDYLIPSMKVEMQENLLNQLTEEPDVSLSEEKIAKCLKIIWDAFYD